MQGPQVRQAVLVANTLIDEYRVVIDRYMVAWAHPENGIDAETIRPEIERVYTGIWEQLDTAAQLTRSAGRATAGYDQLRADPRLVVGAAIARADEKHVSTTVLGTRAVHKFELTVHHNGEGIQFARQASTALAAEWPEVDFRTTEEPVPDLRPRGIGRLIVGLSKLFRGA